MKIIPVLIVLLLLAGLAGLAQAVPPGLVLEFDGGREGKVYFHGDVHSGTGMYCADCHMEIFDVSRISEITRREHTQEVYCFVCHNGEMAFAPRRNCSNCHLDEEDEAG